MFVAIICIKIPGLLSGQARVNSNTVVSYITANSSNGASANMPSGDMFLEEKGEPCHLSSSLYYGGQDVYSHSPSTHTPGTYPIVSHCLLIAVMR